MRLWANFIGYQIVWFCAVIAAAHGMAWPGVGACVVFAVWQVGIAPRRAVELKLMALALGCGLVLDGVLAASGWLIYATPAPALPTGGAPLWILALWVSFALTLTQSLRYLQKRLWLACLFGAIGGPLAFLCAARGLAVVTFVPPQWQALLALALGWALAMPLLAGMARHWSHMGETPNRTLSWGRS